MKMLSLILPGIFAISLSTARAEDAPPVDCPTLLEMPALTPDLVQQVQSRQAISDILGRDSNRVSEESKTAMQAVSDVERIMSKRELYLWDWLARVVGGDKERLTIHRQSRKTFEQKISELEEIRLKAKAAEAAVIGSIEEWLIANQKDFAQLRRQQQELYDVVCKGRDCVKQIENATDEIDSAQSADMVSAATDNAGLDYLAKNATDEANEATNKAKAAVARFKAAVELLRKDIETHPLTAAQNIDGVDSNFQFFFDIGTNTGFMDIMNYFKLGEISDQLEDIKEKVEAANAHFIASNDVLDKKLKDYLCSVRSECLR